MTGPPAGTASPAARSRRRGYLAFATLSLAYLLTSYAGIRSADSEVVFEGCDALLHHGTFAIEGESTWSGFGLSKGLDGRSYAIFGPLQSIACVPLLALADAANRTPWFQTVRPQRSHYIDGGLRAAIQELPSAVPVMHARRSLVAWLFNALVGAMGVLTFLRLALRFAAIPASAYLVTAGFAFCGLWWPYSGTFFSEPLATLLMLLSFNRLIAAPPPRRHGDAWQVLGAGLLLGLATATHLTAILALPLALLARTREQRPESAAAPVLAAAFTAGLVLVLGPLGLYNQVRFGSLFETGRGLGAAAFGYGTFQAPWRGLFGLTVSPGKGLLLFCPLVLLGILGWRRFHRLHPRVSLVLLIVVFTRLLFVAARSDWHGGFSLGPRYLVMSLPLLLLPALSLVDHLLARRHPPPLVALFAFLAACSVQQFYFVVGEIFSFLHMRKALHLRSALLLREARGGSVLQDDDLYLSLSNSPLFELLDGMRGPFLLRDLEVSNQALWAVGSLAICAGWLAAWRAVRRSAGSPKGSPSPEPHFRSRTTGS